MKCPFCSHSIHEDFVALFLHNKDHESSATLSSALDAENTETVLVQVLWMICPECFQILIKIRRRLYIRFASAYDNERAIEEWFAVPRKRTPRPIDELVPEPLRSDYIEASNVLDDSPRSSAVLARDILARLLATYAGRSEYNLASRIDRFIDDRDHPQRVKENVRHLREIGDFGAHKQTDQSTGSLIDVGREEAEFTLDIIDGLFDYFVVGPAKDRSRRAAFDEKIEAAGRKPVKAPDGTNGTLKNTNY